MTVEPASADRATEPTPSGRRPVWGRVASGLLFVYLMWWALSLAAVAWDRGAFNDLQRQYQGMAVKVVLAVVALATVGHLADGMLTMSTGADVGSARAEKRRVVARFLVPAVGLPLALAVVWPALPPVAS